MTESTEETHRPNKWALGAGIGFFVLMAIFWIAVFSGAFTKRNPDKLYDESWVARAGSICTPVARTIEDLPNASTVESAAERADLLDAGTAVLDPMVAELEALPLPSRDTDRIVVTGVLEDWQIYLQDRRNYAEALREDPMAEPLMTEVHGGWVSDAIDTMAKANDIIDCATPGDM